MIYAKDVLPSTVLLRDDKVCSSLRLFIDTPLCLRISTDTRHSLRMLISQGLAYHLFYIYIFGIVHQEVLWSIWGSHQTLWSIPLPNVTWHSGKWPYTMTPSIDKTLHQFANLIPNWTLFLPIFGGFHRTLQRMRLANRGRLLLRTPGPVPFGTWICFNVETILSWTCNIYGPFEFRSSLGTSILLLQKLLRMKLFIGRLFLYVGIPTKRYQSKVSYSFVC